MIKGYIGLGVVALFCLMWWRLDYHKSKAKELKAELAKQVTLTKNQSEQIKSLAEANIEQSKSITELEFVNLQWSKRLEQTKEQFEQAKTEQAKELQSIRSKYDEARSQSNDSDIIRDDVISLRKSACRYCDQDPYSRSDGADSLPD